MSPISLSGEQMRIVRDTAWRIPHPRRSPLIAAVLDELLPVETIMNEHVHHAARLARQAA